MPNAKRPAGPTKPTHIEREKAIEREQIDEALGGPAADDEGIEEPGAAASDRSGRASTTERSAPSEPGQRNDGAR